MSQCAPLPALLVFGGCRVLPWLVSTLRQLLDSGSVVWARVGFADVGALEPLLALAQERIHITTKTLKIGWAIEGLDALPKAGATLEH